MTGVSTHHWALALAIFVAENAVWIESQPMSSRGWLQNSRCPSGMFTNLTDWKFDPAGSIPLPWKSICLGIERQPYSLAQYSADCCRNFVVQLRRCLFWPPFCTLQTRSGNKL